MNKIVWLVVLLGFILLGLFLYTRSLESRSLAVQIKNSDKDKNLAFGAIEQQVTDNPFFDLTVIKGRLIEIEENSTDIIMKVETSRNNKSVYLKFNLGNRDRKISTRQVEVNKNGQLRKESYEAMSSLKVVNIISELENPELQIFLPLKIKSKPTECDLACQDGYKFIEGYLIKNTEYVYQFSNTKMYELGGIYEISWSKYE